MTSNTLLKLNNQESLYWSAFGLVNLYVTNLEPEHYITKWAGSTMFGTYNLINVIVIINVLIAMMNNSYQEKIKIWSPSKKINNLTLNKHFWPRLTLTDLVRRFYKFIKRWEKGKKRFYRFLKFTKILCKNSNSYFLFF